MVVLRRFKMNEQELNIYLLEQAFDNIQFLMRGSAYNYFALEPQQINTSDRHCIYNLYIYCIQHKYNPVWVMAICFDRYKFLSRKRKHLPVMLPSQLNTTHIEKAIQSSTNYETYKKNHDVLHFPYLSSLYLIALKVWFMLPYKQLVEEAKHEIKQAEYDFYKEPYIRPDLEALRQRVLSVKSARQNIWRYILFFEGAYSFYTPIFLVGEKPSTTLINFNELEFEHALNGLNDNDDFKIESYNNLQYLQRAVNQISKVKGLV